MLQKLLEEATVKLSDSGGVIFSVPDRRPDKRRVECVLTPEFFRFCPSVKTSTEGHFFQNKITDRDKRETAVQRKKKGLEKNKQRK